jgi:hypothetical protein
MRSRSEQQAPSAARDVLAMRCVQHAAQVCEVCAALWRSAVASVALAQGAQWRALIIRICGDSNTIFVDNRTMRH